ncbi:MAG: PilN domain-containing protein [Acidobacteria bacterium]|jgi:type IV pilus assembly protein PilN|nr:PilN domain-containing protein [Acidobacteriota bacterium]
MIHINLLSPEREQPRHRRAVSSFDGSGQKVTVACTLILAVAGVGVAWWYWSLQQESSRLAEQLANAQQESQRLRSNIVQVQKYEDQRAQLQQRVTLIEQLRRGQNGPVHMLDEISRSLPDQLWLTQLEQKGSDLTVEGRCIALTSLSDFVGNLERSGWFKKPVEIIDSQLDQVQGAETTLIRFTIKARFAPPGA